MTKRASSHKWNFKFGDTLDRWELYLAIFAASLLTLIQIVSGVIQILQNRQPPPWIIILAVLLLAFMWMVVVVTWRRARANREEKKREKHLADLDARVRAQVLAGQWNDVLESLQELLDANYKGLRDKQGSYRTVLYGKLTLEESGELVPKELLRDEQETRRIDYWDRDALVIGLGEVGYEILRQVKARFVEEYGPELPKLIRFLVVDTVVRAGNPIQARNGVPVDLDVIGEVLTVGDLRIADAIANLDRQPFASWLIPKQKPPWSIDIQADKVKHSRKLGRLALYWSFFSDEKNILTRLESDVQQLRHHLSKMSARERGIRERDRGLDVFIVSAAGDDLGSGMLLDLAYLVHHAMETRSIPQHQYKITGIIVLPSSLTTVSETDRSQAATFALLRELDHMMQGAEFSAKYKGETEITFQRIAPFQDCYLIGSKRGISDPTIVALEIAESIFLQVTSQVGQLLREGREQKPGYSALGVATKVFPAQTIVEVCARKLVLHLLEQLQPQQTENCSDGLQIAHSQALDTLNSSGLNLEMLWARLSGSAALENNGIDWGSYSKQVYQAAASIETETKERIIAKIKGMIRARPKDFSLITEYLRKLADSLTVLLVVLREEKEHPRSFAKLTVGQRKELYEALARVVENILCEVIGPLERAVSRVQTMIARMKEEFSRQLDGLGDELRARGTFESYHAASDDSIQEYYNKYASQDKDADSLLMQEFFDQMSYPFDWGGRHQTDVMESSLAFCRRRFLDILALSIEEVGKLTMSQLTSLKNQAQPLWEWDIPSQGTPFVIFGVGNVTHELYRKSRHKGYFATTNDIYRISCLHTLHGLRLSDLAFYESYRQAYQSLSRGERAYLHCYPDLLDDDEEKVIFALAHALGLITPESDGKYWHHDEARVLGCCLSEALGEFLCDDELIDLTKELVGQGEKEKGIVEMKTMLEHYTERLKQDCEDTELRMKLTYLVKQHLIRM